MCIGLAIGLCSRTVTRTVNMSCLGKWTVSLKNFVVVLITGYDDFALSNSLGKRAVVQF